MESCSFIADLPINKWWFSMRRTVKFSEGTYHQTWTLMTRGLANIMIIMWIECALKPGCSYQTGDLSQSGGNHRQQTTEVLAVKPHLSNQTKPSAGSILDTGYLIHVDTIQNGFWLVKPIGQELHCTHAPWRKLRILVISERSGGW